MRSCWLWVVSLGFGLGCGTIVSGGCVHQPDIICVNGDVLNRVCLLNRVSFLNEESITF